MYHSTSLVVTACILALTSGSYQAVVTRQTGTAGCGNSKHFIGKTRAFDLQSNGTSRKYLIHLPNGYDKDIPTAALLAFHGRGSDSSKMEGVTRFSQHAINPDIIAIYPQGVEGSWQGPTYAKHGVNDMLFTDDLVKHLKDNYCIDDRRIYAAGYSNGGGLVDGLACSSEYGHHFAAFACVNSAYYLDLNDSVCDPQRSPVPILSLHGTADKTVPYDGGEGIGGPLPSIEGWVERWTSRNECVHPSNTNLTGDVEQTEWDCGDIDKLQRHYKMVGHGHTYPGADDNIDASALVVDYFSASRAKKSTDDSPKPSEEPDGKSSSKPSPGASAAPGQRYNGIRSKAVGLAVLLMFTLEF